MTAKNVDTMRKRRALGRWFSAAGKRLRENPHGSGAMPISSRLATWVGIFSACVGGFLGLDTYKTDVSKKVDQSVEKTFEMVHKFNEPKISEARFRVLTYVDAKRYCDSRMISRELIDNDFVTVLDFFDLANACVEAKLCDRDTAIRFFAPYANYQWPILEKIVTELSSQEQSLRKDSNFGEGMQSFANDVTAAPPCDGNF